MLITLADTLSPSWDLVADIQILLHFHFMQNAYLAGTLVAIIAGIMGYFMVLRSQSFAGHSLANVGFAGATGAALFGISPIVGLFLAGVLAAVGIQALNLGARQSRQSDIAVGAMLTASLALGFLFIFLATAEYAANVYNVLFGNVLGISDSDVGIIAWSTLVLVGIFVLIARPLFFASIDPNETAGADRARECAAHLCAASHASCHCTGRHYPPGCGCCGRDRAGAHFHLAGAGRGVLHALPRQFFHYDLRLWHLCPRARRAVYARPREASSRVAA